MTPRTRALLEQTSSFLDWQSDFPPAIPYRMVGSKLLSQDKFLWDFAHGDDAREHGNVWWMLFAPKFESTDQAFEFLTWIHRWAFRHAGMDPPDDPFLAACQAWFPDQTTQTYATMAAILKRELENGMPYQPDSPVTLVSEKIRNLMDRHEEVEFVD